MSETITEIPLEHNYSDSVNTDFQNSNWNPEPSTRVVRTNDQIPDRYQSSIPQRKNNCFATMDRGLEPYYITEQKPIPTLWSVYDNHYSTLTEDVQTLIPS